MNKLADVIKKAKEISNSPAVSKKDAETSVAPATVKVSFDEKLYSLEEALEFFQKVATMMFPSMQTSFVSREDELIEKIAAKVLQELKPKDEESISGQVQS